MRPNELQRKLFFFELIGFRGEPVVTRVVRWNQAMPQYHVGHLDRVKRIEAAIDQVDGLALMSNALHGVGIAPVIEGDGDRAATVSRPERLGCHQCRSSSLLYSRDGQSIFRLAGMQILLVQHGSSLGAPLGRHRLSAKCQYPKSGP